MTNKTSRQLAIRLARQVEHDDVLRRFFPAFALELAVAPRTTLSAPGDSPGAKTLPRHHLWVAEEEGSVVAAALTRIMPGRIAMLWPPRLQWDCAPQVDRSERSGQVLRQLMAAVDAFLTSQNVQIVQALADTASAPDALRLADCGLVHLTDLLYLVSRATDSSAAPIGPSAEMGERLDFLAFENQQFDRMAALVEQTYEGTLDCPQLNGMRPVADVLDEHRAVGVFRPDWWLFARQDGHDVGCLLLADHPAQSQVELVYMGIVPLWRGRGLGLQIVRHARWLTGNAGRARLVLAVDAENRPAIAMYAAAGFLAWDRRAVFLKCYSRHA